MILQQLTFTLIGSVVVFSMAACKKSAHEHEHDTDEQAQVEGGADNDNDAHPHEGGDHDHSKKVPGPNGGRLLTGIEPHAEFLVKDDRTVEVRFLDLSETKAAPLNGQLASVVAGERSNPTTLTLVQKGDVLVSTQPLPDGDDYPLIVTLKTSSDAEPVREKFTMDFTQCPTCDYLEYACICDH